MSLHTEDFGHRFIRSALENKKAEVAVASPFILASHLRSVVADCDIVNIIFTELLESSDDEKRRIYATTALCVIAKELFEPKHLSANECLLCDTDVDVTFYVEDDANNLFKGVKLKLRETSGFFDEMFRDGFPESHLKTIKISRIQGPLLSVTVSPFIISIH